MKKLFSIAIITLCLAASCAKPTPVNPSVDYTKLKLTAHIVHLAYGSNVNQFEVSISSPSATDPVEIKITYDVQVTTPGSPITESSETATISLHPGENDLGRIYLGDITSVTVNSHQIGFEQFDN